ncbi:hypothetical protein Tco_0975065 [Tanacetum coccineum]|uniref:Uncharacterized protein n=1 Tax=Tanacetum coccineum TaxID=301880 RepID=A0ABQ5EDN8_9ASTR
METDEISERYIAQCFVNGLEAFDGEINLAFDENLISNEFAVKLCLDYEVKKGKRLVKKELIVALKGELYFVKFIINPEEDDFIPGVILGRSFLRLSRGIVDFGNGVITIYPEPDPFEDDSEKTGKRKCMVLTEDVVRILSAPISCRDLDTTTHRDLIDSDGKLIPEDRQSVFEHMAGVYSVPLQGAYNPPGYTQPQYDQYYQRHPPPPPQYQPQQQQDDEE